MNMDDMAAEAKTAIEAHHKAFDKFSVSDSDTDYGDFVLASSHIEGYAIDWLRALLAERERLLGVVATAEAIVHAAEHDHHLATNWATERLKQALTALDSE